MWSRREKISRYAFSDGSANQNQPKNGFKALPKPETHVSGMYPIHHYMRDFTYRDVDADVEGIGDFCSFS